MRTFVQKPKTTQPTTFAKSTTISRAHFGQDRDPNAILDLQRTIGNQAVRRLSEADKGAVKGDSAVTEAARFGHDFGQIPVYAKTPAERAIANTKKESAESTDVKIQGVRTFEFNLNDLNSAPQVTDSVAASEKSVEGGEQNFIDDLLVERAPEKDGDGGVVPAGPAPAPPAKVKKAGVDSFEVKWSKHAGSGAANAKLRLDYNAKFKKDDDNDPALAEFRQSVMSTWDITDGPHKGRKGTTSPMHDDNYSRADDLSGNKITDVNFYSNDNPGYDDLDKDDVLDYSFTAEQTIIDTSQANKVIAKRGPHTATVKGKDPRTYDGVPKTLS